MGSDSLNMLTLLFVCSVAKSQRSRSDGRWTTDWSRWLWPTTETPTCRSLPADHSDLQTFVLLQDTQGYYGNPWCQGCRWALFNLHVDPWEDDSARKRKTSKFKNQNPCPLAALVLPSSIFNFHFDTLFHKSLHTFFIFFWKFAFASLPSTTAGNVQINSCWGGGAQNKDKL